MSLVKNLLYPTTIAVALATGACADTLGQSFEIIGNQAEDGTSCVPEPSEGGTNRIAGLYDSQAAGDYVLLPLVKSFAEVDGTTTEQQRTVLIRGARVTIELDDPSLFTASEIADLEEANLLAYEQLFTVSLSPGGLASFALPVVPVELARALGGKLVGNDRTSVTTRTTLFGELADGEAESRSFPFPVTICNGCLFSNEGTCPLPAGTEVRAGNACNPGQDSPVTCCGPAEDPTCPATVDGGT